MKLLLTAAQGRLLRALVLFLSNESKDCMREGDSFVVESITSSPWSSLTFSGDRHRVVGRLPAEAAPVDFDAREITLPGVIVAVEGAEWQATAAGLWLTVDLLAIAAGTVEKGVAGVEFA